MVVDFWQRVTEKDTSKAFGYLLRLYLTIDWRSGGILIIPNRNWLGFWNLVSIANIIEEAKNFGYHQSWFSKGTGYTKKSIRICYKILSTQINVELVAWFNKKIYEG